MSTQTPTPPVQVQPKTTQNNETHSAHHHSHKGRRLNVVVTAFGPFMTITENPSDYVRKHIISQFEKKFADTNIVLFDTNQLPVEDDMVYEYLNALRTKIRAHQSMHSGEEFLIIHLGVNGGRDVLQVDLERRAFNSKTFRGKNEWDGTCKDQIAEDQLYYSHTRTRVPINEIYSRLKPKHPFLNVSDSAGRYLCNYI